MCVLALINNNANQTSRNVSGRQAEIRFAMDINSSIIYKFPKSSQSHCKSHMIWLNMMDWVTQDKQYNFTLYLTWWNICYSVWLECLRPTIINRIYLESSTAVIFFLVFQVTTAKLRIHGNILIILYNNLRNHLCHSSKWTMLSLLWCNEVTVCHDIFT